MQDRASSASEPFVSAVRPLRYKGYKSPMRRTPFRHRAASAVSDGFFRSLSRLGRLHPASRPAYHGVESFENIPYIDGGGREQTLDIYRPVEPPASRRGYPVALYVHGGGFRALSKETHWFMGLAFARAGYVVFNISYRLAPIHPFPAAVADTCAALSWVTRHAAAYGGDVDRLILAGESAGANLVSALTLACCYRRPEPWARAVFDSAVMPRATLPYCGLLEVSNPGRFARRRPLPGWINGILHHIADTYLPGEQADEHAGEQAGLHGPPGFLDLANPLTTLERARAIGQAPDRPLPPFFVAVGTRDPLLDDTRRLERVLAAMDVPCEARYYPGEIHAFHAMIWRHNARAAWRHTFEFLARHNS